ncbi:hypothetical protein [Actinorugispora endophytica]|uniref:hypothetical protein n=1 Tax=Actinorugispora endophytica TaxID=1605990 RepID=UPI00105E0A9E|nr:hypothetical protein [Actinorugispora endophytica]
MRPENLDFSGRKFTVSYYTPRRHALLLSSYAEWGGYDESIRVAFFGVSEFFISQALKELVVDVPSPWGGSGGLLRKYPVSWGDGKGYVIAEGVDVERVQGKNASLFRDKWGILEIRPIRPAGWPG